MKRTIVVALAIALVPYGCAAKRAPLSAGAPALEVTFYEHCTAATARDISVGQRSLYCACAARIYSEQVPPEWLTKSGLTAEENDLAKQIGATAGRTCAPVVAATVAQCNAALTAVPPGEARTSACDCFLAGLTTEFSPAELVALSRRQFDAVPNGGPRTGATYERCSSAPEEGVDWGTALSVASVVLGAAALALSIATATSTPDVSYIFVPTK